MRQRVKPFVPAPIRWMLRGGLHYFQRIYFWIMVLREVKGYAFRDRVCLYLSALVGVFTSFWSLQEWRNPISLFNLNVHVPSVGNFRVRANTDDLWHVLPSREREVFQAIEKILKEGSTFVDAGANIGFYTVLASRLVGDKGSVIAIEMMPETANILAEHIRWNCCNNVEIHQCALYEKEGETISAKIPTGKYGQASIMKNSNQSDLKVIKVITSTLDSLLSNVDRIDLIKMDIEGAEFSAIKGAKVSLERFNAVIFEDLNGASPVRDFLSKEGFMLQSCSGREVLAQRIKINSQL